MTHPSRPTVQPFSAHYDLVQSANVFQYSDDEATMDQELLTALEDRFGKPVVGYVDGLHYQFKPQNAVPPNGVVVPERNHDNPQTLLIQR